VTIIVIAATNRPDVLDPAILRRFDRQVHVGYPNAKGREAILLLHARRINCDTSLVDWAFLASLTDDFSGADLRNVINEAALLAVRGNHPKVEQRYLEQAIERVQRMKAQIGGTVTPYFVRR
jgi:cell division protease FtsH